MQFNYRNNVIVDLAAAVAAGVTTVNVDPVTQALLPDGVQNTLATLEEIDANGVITLRECIEITNRSGGALTVVRADQLVPASDAATTQTQISYPFDPSNGARIGLYATKKAFELIEADIAALQAATTGDFVTETALIDNVDLYAASVTGTDAYEILIDTLDQGGLPVYTALVDGQRFFVDFDVLNTGGATLTINNSLATFGPKALTKLNGQPLASGDITIGLKTIVMYDAGDDHWRIVGTLGNYSSSLTVDAIQKDFVLGEDFPLSGDNEGAGFLGKSETVISNALDTVTVGWGENAGNEKVRFCFDRYDTVFSIDTLGAVGAGAFPGEDFGQNPPPGFEIRQRGELVTNFGGANYFNSFTASLSISTVATTDSVICTVYDGVNGAIVAQSTNVIAGSSLTVGLYSNEVFNFGIVKIDPTWTELFFVLTRSGALDNTDYYLWEDTNFNSPDSSVWKNIFLWNEDTNGSHQFRLNFLDTNIESNNIREYSAFLQKQGAPADDINVTFWEDAIQLTPDLSGDITNAEVTGVNIDKILQRAWASGEGRYLYIEFDRVAAVDAINFYQIKTDVSITSGFTYQLWDGATWTTGAGSPVGSGTFGFTADNMWLSDNRSTEADASDGVILSTGLVTDTRTFVTSGYKIQSAGTLGGGYYIDSTDGGITLGHFVQNVTPEDQVVRGTLIGEQKTTTEMELYIPESNFHRIGTPAIRIPGLTNTEYLDPRSFTPTTSATLILEYQHTMIRNGGYTIQVFRNVGPNDLVWLDFDASVLNIGDIIQVFTRETGGNIFGELWVNGIVVDTVATATAVVKNFKITYDEVFTYTTTA